MQMRPPPQFIGMVAVAILATGLLVPVESLASSHCAQFRQLAQQSWRLFRNSNDPYHRLSAQNYETGYRRCISQSRNRGGGGGVTVPQGGGGRLGAALGVMQGALGLLQLFEQNNRQSSRSRAAAARAQAEALKRQRVNADHQAQQRSFEVDRQRMNSRLSGLQGRDRLEGLDAKDKLEADATELELAALRKQREAMIGKGKPSRPERGAGPDLECEDPGNLLTCRKLMRELARRRAIQAPRNSIKEAERDVARIWANTPSGTGRPAGRANVGGDPTRLDPPGECELCDVIADVLKTAEQARARQEARRRAAPPPLPLPPADWDQILGSGEDDEWVEPTLADPQGQDQFEDLLEDDPAEFDRAEEDESSPSFVERLREKFQWLRDLYRELKLAKDCLASAKKCALERIGDMMTRSDTKCDDGSPFCLRMAKLVADMAADAEKAGGKGSADARALDSGGRNIFGKSYPRYAYAPDEKLDQAINQNED